MEAGYFFNHGNLIELSEQQLVDCSRSYGNGGCNGGNQINSYKYAEHTSIETESDYPYTARDGTCHSHVGAAYVTSYASVAKNSYSAMMAALQKGPVSVGVDAGALVHYTGGVISSCGTSVDHAVMVVGYDSNSWIVKNSWGASWGENGYFRLAITGDGPGTCGVYLWGSVPTMG